ncbi:MAG: FtsQ-type POTRA domain-containing protein, partial [Desulfobacteraceae bacterium]|nr:FtsQ-type POTRA domain-containing protein [Desulfobacteraceae bacterium]
MKKNRYKNKLEKTVSMNFISKPLIMILVLCLTSIALIYTYDFIMQSTYFNIKKIHINGNVRIKSQEIINLAKIKKTNNILSLNLSLLQKRILSHPWIQDVSLKRSLPSGLLIKITEETPFAIVKIKNISEILINNQGIPFKEYEPDIDKVGTPPIITGLELTESEDQLIFEGQLFNLVLKVLGMNGFGKIHYVNADKNMGISIKTKYFNKEIFMRLGFYDFSNKAYKAEQITNYFKHHIVNKEICTFDLYDPENVLVKSKDK